RVASAACQGDAKAANCGKVRTARGELPLERRVEEAEPPAELGLDRQLAVELRLQLELLRVVALLVLAGRHERPERAALVPADEVDGTHAADELEQPGEQLLAEDLLLEALGNRVDGGDPVL